MNRKDIIRPIYGTVMLQPLAFLWCQLTGIPYLENLGPLTVLATIYLMPIYTLYERKFPQP